MNRKKILSLAEVIIIILSVSIVFYPSIVADREPCTVYGYIYVDEIIMEPDEVILSFPDQDIEATLYPDGYYIVDFAEDVGETGIFFVTINVETYTADETITVQYCVYAYEIDLHITTIPPNNPPNKPTEPSPENNSENIDINPTLSVNVTDPDGDTMNVSFFDASDDSLIDTDLNVESGSTASIIWSDLSYNTTYHWYAVANDSQLETRSDTWIFTTKENNPPDKPVDPLPENNSENVDINPYLSVNVTDPDGDSMDVSFYNASDDGLIGTHPDVNSGETATVQWTGLSVNTTYTWYAIANDSEYENKSDIWIFTTIEEVNNPPDMPSNPLPGDNAQDVDLNPTLYVDVSDPDGDNMSVSFYDASDDSLIDTDLDVVSGGTASVEWTGLSYNTQYSWYAIANDSELETKSDIWNFTTKEMDNNPPCVKIIKPDKAFYLFNVKIRKYLLRFRIPLIIGKINIEANATDEDSGIERVEFYINGKLKSIDTIEPYTILWRWNRPRIIHLFTIKVVAYDNAGNNAEDKMLVRKIL